MKRKQYKEIRVDYKYFLILFILVIIRCKTDVNKPSIDQPISPIPTEKTIALIIPYQNSGWSVAVTYNYKDFHQLTYIPFVSFVDWSPDKQYLIYLQSLQKEDQLNQEVWIMKYDGSNKKRISQEGNYCSDPRISPDGNTVMYTELEEIFLRIITCDLDGNNYKEVLGPKSIPNKDSCYVYGQCWKSKNEIVFTYNEKNSTTWSVGVLDLLSDAISYITCIDTLNPYIIQWSPKYNEMVFVGKGDPGKGTQIWAVNIDGTKVRKLSDCFLARAPDLSPDEEKVIFSQLTNGPDDMYTIWVVDRDGSNNKQLLADDNYDLIEPVW